MTTNMPDILLPFLRNYTKFIQHGDILYRVKIKYDQDSFKDRTVTFSRTELSCEIEQCLRAVMYMYLHERTIRRSPIASDHLLIIPSFRRWEFPLKYPNYGFKRNGKVLKAARVNIELTVKHIDECVVKEQTSVRHTVEERNQAVNGHTNEKQYQEETVPCPRFIENSISHRQCGETKSTVTSHQESEPYKTQTGQENSHSENTFTNTEEREPHENKTEELPSYLEMLAGTELERRKRDPVSVYQDILQNIKETRLKEMAQKNYKSFPQVNPPMESQLGLLKSHTRKQMECGSSLSSDFSNRAREVQCSLSK